MKKNDNKPVVAAKRSQSVAHHRKINSPATSYPRTLQEIKTRKAVNQVKIELAQAKLIDLFTPQRDPKVQAAASIINRFDTIMQYAQYASLAINVFKRLRNFFRK